MCLAREHNTVMQVWLEHSTPRSRVKNATTEPLRYQFRVYTWQSKKRPGNISKSFCSTYVQCVNLFMYNKSSHLYHNDESHFEFKSCLVVNLGLLHEHSVFKRKLLPANVLLQKKNNNKQSKTKMNRDNLVCATSKGSDQPAHRRGLIKAFASRLNILLLLGYWLNSILVSMPKRRHHRLIWVYTCQNATLLEITCAAQMYFSVMTIWDFFLF